MKTFVRYILSAGGRGAAFVRGHPDDDPASTLVADRLVELVDHGEELAQQQRAGQIAYSAASNQKAELRISLENDLAALVGIARIAAKVHPELTVHRRLPPHKANEATFLTAVRVATAEARAAESLLAPYGLSPRLLASLTAGLAAYDIALDRQANALAAQVGAGAELEAVGSEILDVIRNLDAVYRVRFKQNRELMAAWKSARNVAWPRQARGRRNAESRVEG